MNEKGGINYTTLSTSTIHNLGIIWYEVQDILFVHLCKLLCIFVCTPMKMSYKWEINKKITLLSLSDFLFCNLLFSNQDLLRFERNDKLSS